MKKMSSRIKNITKLTKTENRFCDSRKKMCLKYLINVQAINYNEVNKIIECRAKESKSFLLNSI